MVLHLTSGSITLDVSFVNPDTREIGTASVDASWDGMCGRVLLVLDGRAEDPISDCVPTDALPSGFDDVFVVVGEVNGDWYISYIETILAYAELFLEDELGS